MNTFISVGNVSMKMNFSEMQDAFAQVANCKKNGFATIKTGLEVIQGIADFLTKSSENQKVGRLSKAAEIQIKMKYFKQDFIQAVFILTGGKVDLQEENILLPSKDKTMQAVTMGLKANLLGKIVLLDLNKQLLNPLSESLDEIERAILEHLMKGVEVDDMERKLLEGIGIDASRLSSFEKANRTGSYVSGFGTNANLHSALIAESKQIRKPKDVDKEEYQTLKTLLDNVKQQREVLARISAASEDHPGFGLTPKENTL